MPRELPPLLQSAWDRPIAVLGAGVSGRGAVRLVEAFGGTAQMFDQQAPDCARWQADSAGEHRLVVSSPGFAPDHPWLEAARQAGAAVLTEIDFAGLFWKGEVVAVTGTNGKTTLTEFLTQALRGAGLRAEPVGNVGRAFSELVAEEEGRGAVAVCEVSSFQAEALLHLRPRSVLWTNLAEDHLERHADMRAYFEAKHRLVSLAGAEALLAGSSVSRWASSFGQPLASSAFVPTEGLPRDARLEGSLFAEYPQRENFVLAEAFWRRRGLPEASLLAAARAFVGGRHRLAKVAEVAGVTFWNDSKATNFHAVEAALTRFAKPVLWIGGGRAKGGDLAGFVRRLAGRVHTAFLIGESAASLAAECTRMEINFMRCGGLAEAVESAFGRAGPGDQVLLSPGFASFDLFRNYEHRGECFEKLVRNLGTPTILR